MTRQGKIARLPAEVRDHVSQLLHDGKPYRSIVAWLIEQGHPGFTCSNVSRWKLGGYQDWLKAQERLDERDFKHQLAEQHAQANDSTFHDAGIHLAQLQFFEALHRLDGVELTQLVKKNRKEFIQLLKTFTHFNRYCLQREKFRHDVARKDKANITKVPSEAITDPTLEKICNKLGLR